MTRFWEKYSITIYLYFYFDIDLVTFAKLIVKLDEGKRTK